MNFTPLDPRTKLIIKDSIEEFLYDPFRRQMRRRIQEIAVKNCRKLKSGHLHFVYKETLYNLEDRTNPLPTAKNRLIPELRKDMEECLAEQRQIEDEMPYVMGFVVGVLNASNAPGDWLKLFPESTHYIMKKVLAAKEINLDWNKTTLPADIIEKMCVQYHELISIVKQRMTINILIS